MRKPNVLVLFLIFIALIAMIVANYCTVRVISASRSYINGESEYSKGQKDALLYLEAYMQTRDTVYWNLFNNCMQVPIGDDLARNSILNNDPEGTTAKYFAMGKNNIKDIPDMICLFKTFRSSFMSEPIKLWGEATPMINKLFDIGNQIHSQVQAGPLTDSDKSKFIMQASFISGELSKKESAFSRELSDEIRKVNTYLILINLLCLLVLVVKIKIYNRIMIRRLKSSYEKIEAQNAELKVTNNELDTFVYSISHDLRAPITSIKGLIHIIDAENDAPTIKEYVRLINDVIIKQDNFILEILDIFRSKRLQLKYRNFSLGKLINDIVENNRFSPLAQGIAITKDYKLDDVYTDELRLKMILNNLVSNAKKYSDERKPAKSIFIRTFIAGGHYIIQIEDNGIGIEPQYLAKIYDLFFVTSNDNKGSGLGLYILKQNVEILKGTVNVISELNHGTTFTIKLPIPPRAD